MFNTGENIKEEDMFRIWNRFYKADESRNRQDGGTGIGLSIVKLGCYFAIEFIICGIVVDKILYHNELL